VNHDAGALASKAGRGRGRMIGRDRLRHGTGHNAGRLVAGHLILTTAQINKSQSNSAVLAQPLPPTGASYDPEAEAVAVPSRMPRTFRC
jgi:hypothetical protein